MASSLVVAVAVLGSAASALQFFPQPTGKMVLPGDGVDPLPTPGPQGFVELHKRQNLNSLVVEVAPDNTCGFVSGSLGAHGPYFVPEHHGLLWRPDTFALSSWHSMVWSKLC